MAIITFLFHIFLDYLLGRRLLPFLSNREKTYLEKTCLAILVGVFLETTFSFWFLWAGGSITIFSILFLVATIGINIPLFLKDFRDSSSFLASFRRLPQTIKSFRWYEWILGIFILEKIIFISWQLLRMPTYHSDALKHWSAAAKAMYTGKNYTLTSGLPSFLGKKMGFVSEYPLGVPIWRAISASFNMGWNDFIARSDGLLFLLLLAGLIYVAFKYFTNRRWMALGAAFIVVSLPLQVWQGASGYVDNAVAVFALATIWSFIRKDWILSGLFAAGAIWSKNDGLAIFLPGFLAAAFFYNVFLKEITWGVKLKRLIHIGVGIVPIVPWLVFQALYSSSIFNRIVKPIQGLFSSIDVPDYQVVLVQTGKRFENSPGSLSLFWEHVFTGSSHGIFWLVALLAIILLSKKLITDLLGRCLLFYMLITSVIIYYVFTYTPAYEFLLIQTTIHRTMMQFAPVVLVIIGYGLFLCLDSKKQGIHTEKITQSTVETT